MITWPAVRQSDVMRRPVESAGRGHGVGCRSANAHVASAANDKKAANRALSTPRDRLHGIGLRHIMWKQFDRLRNDAEVWVSRTQRRFGVSAETRGMKTRRLTL